MNLEDAWKSPLIPQRQWDVIALERDKIEHGKYMEVPPYRAFVDCLTGIINYDYKRKDTMEYPASIIEIGASSGLYSRLIEKAFGKTFDYTGLDYSQAFVDFAKKTHPDVKYLLGDAVCLENIPTNKYDVVISGCCLLHIPEWKKAMREAVRVAKSYVIFHRTPIVTKKQTYSFTKLAYGVECMEWNFNRRDFFGTIDLLGLKVINEVEVFSQPEIDYSHITIGCQK